MKYDFSINLHGFSEAGLDQLFEAAGRRNAHLMSSCICEEEDLENLCKHRIAQVVSETLIVAIDQDYTVAMRKKGITAPDYLSPLTVDDVQEDVRRVGKALGVPEKAAAVVAEMVDRLAVIGEAARSSAPRPRVVHIEWTLPLMVGGHWIPELVECAGGEHALGARGGRTAPIAWEEVRAYDPEVVIVSPCGFKIPQSEKDRALLEALPGWGDTAAARNGRVFVADGNAFFNRPGPRLVETAEIVQAAISGRRHFHRFPPEALQRWS
jgi:iron complex transport system substrate-binding protein